MSHLHTTDSPDLDPRTQKLYDRYLSIVGATKETVTHRENANSFFRAVVADFLTYQISPDELSLVLSKLWWALIQDPIMKLEPITDACDAATEAEWYLRNDPIAGGEYIADVITFYEKIGGTIPDQPQGSRYQKVSLD